MSGERGERGNERGRWRMRDRGGLGIVCRGDWGGRLRRVILMVCLLLLLQESSNGFVAILEEVKEEWGIVVEPDVSLSHNILTKY